MASGPTRRLPGLAANADAPFPPVASAWTEPNGLLAHGGDLSPVRLMHAYRAGIFPWYSQGDPILWWSPDPRAVFDTGALHLSRRQRRQWRHCDWNIRVDHDFAAVVSACATTPRTGQPGTWILPEMQHAYVRLHQLGHAHCLSVHADGELIGGIYGVHVDSVFCGESMFSRASGASRLALAALCRLLQTHEVRWLDAQMPTPYLESLGVQHCTRADYVKKLSAPPSARLPTTSWSGLIPIWTARDFAG